MPEDTTTILLVEDEPQIRAFLRISLEAQGYRVAESSFGDDGIAAAVREQPDLVILDLGLPDMDGQEVVERLREWSHVPILVLSVRSDESGKVRALDAGADDYLTKPAGISELMARIRVLLRKRNAGQRDAATYDVNGLRIEFDRRSVTLNGEPLHLTPKEYELLRLLAQGAGRVLSHQQLLRVVWGTAFSQETHYLRVLVSGLRQKLGDDPAAPRYIITEQGVGYRMRE